MVRRHARLQASDEGESAGGHQRDYTTFCGAFLFSMCVSARGQVELDTLILGKRGCAQILPMRPAKRLYVRGMRMLGFTSMTTFWTIDNGVVESMQSSITGLVVACPNISNFKVWLRLPFLYE